MSATSPNLLLTVAKRPAPGQTKTRLTPPLPPPIAAGLYEQFLLDTLELMRQTPAVERGIAYLPLAEEGYFRSLAPGFALLPQEGRELGERLDNAITGQLRSGYEKVVIMDSDSPSLPAAFLTAAFTALDGAVDVTLGPCDDGGYYLIGTQRPIPRLLREVQMSTPHVVADTLALARTAGLRVHLLPTWYDVDDGASLGRLLAELQRCPPEIARHTRRYMAANRDAFAALPLAELP